MLIDFHSHYPSPNSIICTAQPEELDCNALLCCQGLLPNFWTKEKQAILFENLLSNPKFQMGEIGLDTRFESIISYENQLDIFKNNLDFALEHKTLVSLHCVRRIGAMQEVISESKYKTLNFIWHGYNGSTETAKQLAKQNVLISIGPRYKGDVKALFQVNPNTVLETDYEGSSALEHDNLLSSHYHNIASCLGISLEMLENHCSSLYQGLINN